MICLEIRHVIFGIKQNASDSIRTEAKEGTCSLETPPGGNPITPGAVTYRWFFMIILPTSSGGCFPMQHYPVKSPKASRSQRFHYRRTFHGVDSKRGPSFTLKSPSSRGNHTNKASKRLLSLFMCKGVLF